MSDLEDQLNEVRRNHILDAALEVISEKGFERTTIRQIAKQAGVADGTIYNYFDNKAAIMTSIVGRLTKAERRDLDFAEGTKIDPIEFIESYLPLRMREVEEELVTHKVVLAETLNNPELRDLVNQTIYEPMFKIAEGYFAQIADQKGEAGIRFDPAMTARLMAGPLLGLMVLRMLGDDHVTDNWSDYGAAMGQLLTALFETSNKTES